MRIGSKLKNYLKNSSLNDSGKIFICVCLIICITINFLKVNSFGKDLDLKSKSAVLIDGNTGRILYGKNENEKMPMASTTKIMTCIVALESGKMNQIIKVSSKAASMPKVKMYAKKGEQYYLKDLLYAMMLESFNDAAMIVAEGIGGSQEEFAKMMNKKAKEIGAKNTNFVTPNGLDADNHYSTAYDMALIGAYATKNKQFNEITNTKSYSFTDVFAKRSITVNNKDMFLTMDNEAIGIKTGFTDQAGDCLAASATNGNENLIAIIMNSEDPGRWNDAKALFEWAFEKYDMTVYRQAGVVATAQLTGHNRLKGDTLDISINEDLSEYLTAEEAASVETKVVNDNGGETIEAPVKQGDKVATLEFLLNGEVIGQADAYATRDVGKANIFNTSAYYIKAFFTKVFSAGNIKYGIAVIVVILIVIVILILRNKRKNRYKIKGNYSSRGKYDTSRINAKKRRRRGDRDKYNKYR